ncbi:MAG: site-specific integrase, partial [Amnibacterium sp.]
MGARRRPPGVAALPPVAAIDRFLRHVAVERGLADNTLAAYRRDLARYAAHLAVAGRADVAEVTEADVAAFRAAVRRDAGAAASSAARMLSTVRGLHRFLVEDGVVPDDVAHAT